MNHLFILLLSIFPLFCQAQFIVPVKTFRTPTGRPIELVAFDPSGKLIGADAEGYLFLFDTKNGRLQKILRAHEQKIMGISFSPNGKFMVTTGADLKMFLWSYPDGVETNKINLETQANFIAFAADGMSLLFSGDSTLYLISAPENNIQEVYHATHNITCGVVSRDNRYIVFGSGSNFSLLNFNNKSFISKLECCSGSTITSVDFAKQNIAACRCSDGSTSLVDAISEKKLLTIPGESSLGQSVFSNKGKLIGSCNHGIEAQIWSVSNQKMIGSLRGHTGAVKTAAFSSDDKYLATGSDDGTIRLWLIEDLQKTSELPATEKLENRKVENQVTQEVSSESLEIFVWDDENVDGDIISLNLNGEWILREYSITKTRKKLTLILQPGNNQLFLYAHKLGKEPPNTAAISYMEGNKERTLKLNSDLNNCGAVNFIYKDE